MNYYIYYRVAVPAETLVARVRAMQRELQDATQIGGSLLRQQADAAMWMEVYCDVKDLPAFEAALDQAVDGHALKSLLQPGAVRRVEKFDAV